MSAEKAGELIRGDAKEEANGQLHPPPQPGPSSYRKTSEDAPVANALPEGLQLFTAEPITDRKSAFVGRACRISHPSEAGFISMIVAIL